MLISEPFRQQQIELHARDPDYGSASIAYAPVIANLINRYHFSEVLDYGAGKMRLMRELAGKLNDPVRFQCYEPASDNLEVRLPPQPSEFVVCVDVLECVEPECLEYVLNDLQRVTRGAGFFTIGLGKAMRRLPDGRNTHQTDKPPEWWLEKIMSRWELQTYQKTVRGFAVTVTPYDMEPVAFTIVGPDQQLGG